ncbi:hypothetical protein PYCC9005_000279 [Savitreella phatthalungensis]
MLSFSDALVKHAPTSPAIALTATGVEIDYSTLLEYVSIVKDTIIERELALEARVAILAGKGVGFVAALLGCWAAGVIAVPICITHPLPEMVYTAQDSGATMILASKEFIGRAHEVSQTLDSIDVMDIDDMLANNHSAGKLTARAGGDTGALIIYTSGTTGRPKGAVHTHASMIAQAESLNEAWQYTATDRILHVLPLHHIHGIVNAMTAVLFAGGCVEMGLEKFDARFVWRRLEDKRITLFMAVPTIYTKLLSDQPERHAALQHIRLFVCGSAALPVSVKKRWLQLTGHVLLERYGMTEIGMALSCGLDEASRIDSSVGKPLPGVSVRLVESSSGLEISQPDTPGELWVAGESLFKEYWKRPEQTAQEITHIGMTRWFKTGDIAIISSNADHHGAYFIQGRSSVDIIKSGGYKISALEVERELLELDFVREAAVLGLEDDEWGQRVAALLVVDSKHANTVNLRSLRNELKPRMAPYKIPSVLKVLEALPRNAMGKINKKELLHRYREELKSGKSTTAT